MTKQGRGDDEVDEPKQIEKIKSDWTEVIEFVTCASSAIRVDNKPTLSERNTTVLAVVRLARRTTVSRVRGDYFQDGRVPTGTTTITKRGEVTR